MSRGKEDFMEGNSLAVDEVEAGHRLNLSPRTIANLIALKELRSLKVGRRRLIPVRALDEFLRRDHATRKGAK